LAKIKAYSSSKMPATVAKPVLSLAPWGDATIRLILLIVVLPKEARKAQVLQLSLAFFDDEYAVFLVSVNAPLQDVFHR